MFAAVQKLDLFLSARPVALHLFVAFASLFLLASDSLGESGLANISASGAGSDGSSETVRISFSEMDGDSDMALEAAAEFLDLPMDRARAINEGIAFSTAPNPAARPFNLGGDDANRGRAVDCLAAAQYYEAGGDLEGQRAVAQVVLNRVRHPAYPSTVCGVVFQGAARRTGCQFTFTCDGAMGRRPGASLWLRSQEIAAQAIGGEVYSKVGLATHYHTDWVVPVWSGKLEKITNVKTHLFFRWPGSWGRSAIFTRGASGAEPVIAALAPVSKFHRAEDDADLEIELVPDLDPAQLEVASSSRPALPSLPGVNLRGGELRIAHPQGDAYGFLLPRQLPGSFALLADQVCVGRQFCKVMGWVERSAIPAGFPISQAAQQKMAFLYVYDRANRREIIAWNCDIFPRDDPAECLTDQTTVWDAVQQL